MTCGKGTFPSRRVASESAKRTQSRSYHIGKTVHRIEPYYCPECHGYHITGHNGYTNLNRRNH